MLLLKATLLWSMALAGAALLRKAPAVERHRLWTIGFTAVLVLPLFTATLPSFDVPVPAWSVAQAHSRTVSAVPTAVAAGAVAWTHAPALSSPLAPAALGSAVPASPQSSATRTFTWPPLESLMLAGWAIGTGAAIAMILLSLARVNRLRQIGDELNDESWREMATTLGEQLGLAVPVRLIVHESVTTPMAGGIWRPAIFLPASAAAWSIEQRAIVLAHELAHLRGRDPLRLIAARVAVAVYWFHPLAWVAARRSSVAREQACDAAVLAIGTKPSTYARVLLDFAEAMTAPRQSFAALPIVEPSLLEIRLMEILKDDRRQAPRSRVLLPLILSAAATLTIAAARPLAMVAPVPHSAPQPAPAKASAPGFGPFTSPAAFAPLQRRGNEFACWAGIYGSSFSGSLTTTDHVVVRQIGRSGPDRIIQEVIGDVRVCMLAQNVGDRADELPSAWIAHADRVVMEARRGDKIQRLTFEGAGGQQASWSVDGADRPFDAAAGQWRDRMLAVLDLSWQISSLRGQVSSLRGDISSIRGEESSLRGDISSLRGEVSSMRGDQSSVRGDESSLRGDISSIRGHVSSLRGEISSEEGEISSLNATRDEADAAERTRIDAGIARHRDEIKRIERELADYNEDAKIAEVEKQIKALDADSKVRAIDDQIRQFDLDGKVAKIEQQIKALDVDGKIAAIEKQIDGLDADRKVRDLESRRDKARSDLEAAVGRIR